MQKYHGWTRDPVSSMQRVLHTDCVTVPDGVSWHSTPIRMPSLLVVCYSKHAYAYTVYIIGVHFHNLVYFNESFYFILTPV